MWKLSLNQAGLENFEFHQTLEIRIEKFLAEKNERTEYQHG